VYKQANKQVFRHVAGWLGMRNHEDPQLSSHALDVHTALLGVNGVYIYDKLSVQLTLWLPPCRGDKSKQIHKL
jgi:hypothetical protein